MIKETSIFPDAVDPMFFFQDVDLDHKKQMDEYYSYVANGEYDKAEGYLAFTKGLHGYFAQTFNALENRIYATQSYLESIDEDEKIPFVYTNNPDVEPSNVDQNTIWI